MTQAEKNNGHPARNPMIWIVLVVVALVLFILFGGSRPSVTPAGSDNAEGASGSSVESTVSQGGQEPATPTAAVSGAPEEFTEQPDESSMTPGQEARDYIRQLRQQGTPIPFDEVMQKASVYLSEGRLADAWLLYFFAAREGHVEAMMTLAEMSDPNQFSPDNNLLDRADPVQAYKWYSRALSAGFEPARQRLASLRDWAEQSAARGDRDAQILMLNFQ